MFIRGLNQRADFSKAAVGTYVLSVADAALDRNVVIEVTVMETFANGSGAQPTFKIGQTSTTNKFADTTDFTGLQAGDKKYFAGTLSATKELLVTSVAATGTGTGSINVKAVINHRSIL